MTERPLVLGTRGSALALAQTALVRAALGAIRCEAREIKTTGDRRQDLSLTAVGGDGHGYVTGGERIDPGLFTRELETALLTGEIDVAVHSLKDLPTVMPGGLTLAAVLPRADTADVLVLKDVASLHDLPVGATLATSSLRRQFQLQHFRPDLRVREVRGNVPTRLGKLRARDDWAGLILARAGLVRLGHGEAVEAGRLEGEHGSFAVETLGPEVMLPAVGQGAIGLQCRADDAPTLATLATVNHPPTWTAVTAERALLALLGGGCQMPLGVGTQLLGGQLWLRAILFASAAGSPPLRAEASGSAEDPRAVAEAVAARLRA